MLAAHSLEVYKFGGTSVGSSAAIQKATSIVKATRSRLIVVVSAMGGITDLLLETAKKAANGADADIDFAVSEFVRRHREAVENLLADSRRATELRQIIEKSAVEFQSICKSLAVLGEVTPRILDVSVARGERLSAMIFQSFLQEAGVDSMVLDATEILFVEKRFSNLIPNREKCLEAANKRLTPALDAGRVVVVPGFIATGPEGELLTLGRGGSDYSATLLAEAVGATSVTLFKEVDGFLTADPRFVADARVVPELTYREAAELAYYGAKVLHPRTIIPLLSNRIPLTIKNSLAPDFPGTKVSDDCHAVDFPVKALTAMVNQSMITVTGNGMLGVPGVASKTFTALANVGISVSVITQASSESSICFVVSSEQAKAAQRCLNEAFAFERSARLIDDVHVEQQIAVLAVVGLGMKGTPGIAARVFSAMSRKKINILAIAQGSSELNISVVLRESDVKSALQELHGEFRLEKLRPLPERVEKHVDLVTLGSGQIGRTFIRQIIGQKHFLAQTLGVSASCIAISDRSGPVLNMKGFSESELNDILETKAQGGKLRSGSQGNSGKPQNPAEQIMGVVRKDLFTHAVQKGIVVDVTGDDTHNMLLEFIEQGYHVVLANKRPLTVPMDAYKHMLERAAARKVAIRYEATVGAGLPVLDTIAKLQSAGDQIETVLGCLSGTLGYISTQIGAGVPLSQAVREARQLGYTEPHPADDLSGLDVARKALILSRTIGRNLNLSDVETKPLFPERLFHADPEMFVQRLSEMDQEIADMVQKGASQRLVPRYVARIEKEKLSVGLEMVSENSPLGRLQGTDNQIVIRTRRYDSNPLIVTGPGAGAEVTAAGVVNDVVAIATSYFGV